jgi:hypothetical protein
MEYKTTWSSVKNIKDTTSNNLFYSVENQYCSDDPNLPDKNRYYIRIQNGIDEFYCFITIDSPANTDQQDFEDNYKANAIQT